VRLPDWTKYDQEEYDGRFAIILEELGRAFLAQNKIVGVEQLEMETTSWAYAIEHIPTKRIRLCFARANRDWTRPYPLVASAVKAAWEDIQREWVEGVSEEMFSPDQLKLSAPASQAGGFHDLKWLEDWTQQRGLPEGFRNMDGSVDSGKVIQGQAFPQGADLPRPATWYVRQKAPWELYPDKENVEVTPWQVKHHHKTPQGHDSFTTVDVEFRYWVDRCVEIDFPGTRCEGYVLQHDGVDGKRLTKRGCPMHVERWDGT
jgi:hypothetical protein